MLSFAFSLSTTTRMGGTGRKEGGCYRANACSIVFTRFTYVDASHPVPYFLSYLISAGVREKRYMCKLKKIASVFPSSQLRQNNWHLFSIHVACQEQVSAHSIFGQSNMTKIANKNKSFVLFVEIILV